MYTNGHILKCIRGNFKNHWFLLTIITQSSPAPYLSEGEFGYAPFCLKNQLHERNSNLTS